MKQAPPSFQDLSPELKRQCEEVARNCRSSFIRWSPEQVWELANVVARASRISLRQALKRFELPTNGRQNEP